MKLKFIDESWNGIEYGEVEFENEDGETIIAHYEAAADYYNQFWKDQVNNDDLWESKGATLPLTIDGVHYDNLWCYIVLNETPTFYDETGVEINIEEYSIEF